MNVLLIGSGGREHALAWALAKSHELGTLYAAPGNAGIAEVATLVELDAADHEAVVAFCREKRIGLVVVGPEAPLVAGLVDDLDAAHIPAFGPTREAARLEGSKRFTKELCDRASIPTARYRVFDKADPARLYARVMGAPIVVKADGLAAGKGVVVAATVDEAIAAIDACFEGEFGEAGAEVVIEQCLVGEEASFFALTDGTTVVPLATAQDHKRVGEGDTGPNTGGMGAYSPATVMTPKLIARTMAEIVEPTVRTLAEMGCPYKGVLYAGLMITAEGPKLIEYNVRFGDPECQVLMMRLNGDLLGLLKAAAAGRLGSAKVDWTDDVALTVVMAAKGYPGAYEKGTEIRNVEAASAMPGVEVFHAGTKREDGKLLANGGRVLNVTALGPTVADAQARAYEAVDAIEWLEGFCRRDIGWRAMSDDTEVEETISAAAIEAAIAEMAAASAAQTPEPARIAASAPAMSAVVAALAGAGDQADAAEELDEIVDTDIDEAPAELAEVATEPEIELEPIEDAGAAEEVELVADPDVLGGALEDALSDIDFDLDLDDMDDEESGDEGDEEPVAADPVLEDIFANEMDLDLGLDDGEADADTGDSEGAAGEADEDTLEGTLQSAVEAAFALDDFADETEDDDGEADGKKD
ncbi:MAG: phosphoribosylamine--glycine ligase [Hyphomicrobiales bacterium]|nr:MAG: phosphoribosylamine--glycine ligase [Hyphomicrobiales bacterium]